MNIKISKSKISKHMDNLAKVISNYPHLQSLTGVYINVNESNMQLITSNGIFSMKIILEKSDDFKIIEPGRILIPAKLFRDVIKKQSGLIDIVKEQSKILITSENIKTEINLLDVEDYPRISFENVGSKFTINSDTLKNLINKVSYAAAENERRVLLNGINLKSDGHWLTTSATNTYRLARCSHAIKSGFSFDITIFSKNLKNFIPENAKNDIELNVGDSKISTTFKDTTLILTYIDGMYPNLDKIFEKEQKEELIINRKVLLDLLDKVVVMSNDLTKKNIRLTITEDVLKIESKKNEIGNIVVESKDFKTNIKNEFIISLNASYLKDCLSNIKDTVILRFDGSFNPFHVIDENNKDYNQMILPLRSY